MFKQCLKKATAKLVQDYPDDLVIYLVIYLV